MTAPALTIYNQNFFVAREHLPLDLKPGVNHVNYAGVAAHLEPDSVILRDPDGPRRCRFSSRTIATIPSRRNCCSRSTKARRSISGAAADDGKDIIEGGKIIRSGYIPSSYYAQNYQQPVSTQPIIEVDGVLRFGLPGQPLFPALSGGFDSEADTELAAADSRRPESSMPKFPTSAAA